MAVGPHIASVAATARKTRHGISDQGYDQHVSAPGESCEIRKRVGELLVGYPVMNVDRNPVHFGIAGIPHRQPQTATSNRKSK